MTFNEIIEVAAQKALEDEDYMAAALLERDGRELDRTWEQSTPIQRMRYRGYVDHAYLRLAEREFHNEIDT